MLLAYLGTMKTLATLYINKEIILFVTRILYITCMHLYYKNICIFLNIKLSSGMYYDQSCFDREVPI